MSIPNIVYKAHATGNDFVVYVDPEGAYEPTADEVRMLCERHFGIGGDGLIRLAHPKDVSDLNDAQVDECAAGDAQCSWTTVTPTDHWPKCAATAHEPSPCSRNARVSPTSRVANHSALARAPA